MPRPGLVASSAFDIDWDVNKNIKLLIWLLKYFYEMIISIKTEMRKKLKNLYSIFLNIICEDVKIKQCYCQVGVAFDIDYECQ